MALTDTEDFFRLSVIAMPKRRSIFDFREQRAKQPCLHGYLATAARVKDPVACSGVFDSYVCKLTRGITKQISSTCGQGISAGGARNMMQRLGTD